MTLIILSVILVLLAIPVILIRFRKRWVASFNLAVTNRSPAGLRPDFQASASSLTLAVRQTEAIARPSTCSKAQMVF